VCDLFPRSPYFHLGADEVKYDLYKKDKEIQNTLRNSDIHEIEELYRSFIVKMNEVVKQNGKQMCVWEGFRANGEVKIPNDILVFVFESQYNTSDQLVKDGYNVVNTSWQPIYITPRKKWTPEEIYKWNPNRWENWVEHSLAFNNPIEIPYSEQLKGAQMCSWEQIAEEEIPSIRQRVAAFIEKVWNRETTQPFSEFQEKLEIQDKKFNKFLEI
jgi:hexosaminidase